MLCGIKTQKRVRHMRRMSDDTRAIEHFNDCKIMHPANREIVKPFQNGIEKCPLTFLFTHVRTSLAVIVAKDFAELGSRAKVKG